MVRGEFLEKREKSLPMDGRYFCDGDDMTVVDDIKAQVDLSVLVSETASVRLKKSGKGWKGFCPFHNDKHTQSLVVYPPNGRGGWYWKCFACNDGGTVIDWVLKKNGGWDATEAIKFLAQRAGIDFGGSAATADVSVAARVSAQARRSARRVAMDVFKRWLLGVYDRDGKQVQAGDAEALNYALGRGWNLNTIQTGTLIGFSGRGSEAEKREMREQFKLHGVDLESPEAVEVLGLRGDVAAWARSRGLDPHGFGDSYIMGFMDLPMLIYAHKFDGKIEYLSGRILPGFDEKRKSHNPSAELAGDRRAFRNMLYRHHHLDGQDKGALLYVVEGQGDAVTCGQFGVPAVALCGSSWEHLVKSGEVSDWLSDYDEIIYVADADAAGENVVTGKDNDFAMANALGAMLWVGRTPKKEWTRPDGHKKTIKDVNDLAQFLMDTKTGDAKVDGKTANGLFNEISMNAKRIVVLAAEYAGGLLGHARNAMLEKTLKPMILSIPAEKRALLERDLALALYPNVSKTNATADFTKWLKRNEKAEAERAGNDDDGLPEIETYGGWYPNRENKDSGHLVELFYDREAQKLRLAWAHIKSIKNNEREIGWGKSLTLENKILIAPEYDQLIEENIELNSSAIKFPTRVGEKHTTAQIIRMDAAFYNKFFYAEDKAVFNFSAVWSVNTWVYDCFDAISMLRCLGPYGSGKSDLMYLVGLTSYRFAVTAATTTAKSHEGLAKIYNATDLIDEYDSALQRDDGTLAGYMKARPMRRLAHSFKMMEMMTPTGKTFVPSNTPIYGPTMATGYKATKDKGLESRFMTFNLTRADMMTLDREGYEPGYYPPELEREAEDIRNICLRWRLETWMPHIELTEEERAKYKMNDVLVDPRTNQLFRAAKVMAIKQGDIELFNNLFVIARANYEEQMMEASSSFEAMVLRAVLAADIAKDLEEGIAPKASPLYAPKVAGYKDLVKTGKLGKHGVVRYILYKDLAKILNEIFDVENIEESEDEKKRRKKTQSQTVGKVCHEAFRLPVERRGDGFVVVLNKDRLDIARMRLGLDFENDYNPEYKGDDDGEIASDEPRNEVPQPVQASFADGYDISTSKTAVALNPEYDKYADMGDAD